MSRDSFAGASKSLSFTFWMMCALVGGLHSISSNKQLEYTSFLLSHYAFSTLLDLCVSAWKNGVYCKTCSVEQPEQDYFMCMIWCIFFSPDLDKLKSFCLKHTIPVYYRSRVWKLLLGNQYIYIYICLAFCIVTMAYLMLDITVLVVSSVC